MSQIFNFCAGPAMLPQSVMSKAQAEFVNWQGTGCSVMELSHRSKEFKAVAAKAEAVQPEAAKAEETTTKEEE